MEPRLSPDGRSIAVTIFENSNYDIYRWDIDRPGLNRLTLDPGEDTSAIWHPTEDRLTFSSEASDTGVPTAPELYSMPVGGTTVERQEALSPPERTGIANYPSSYTPDGNTLVFAELDRLFNIWTLSADGRRSLLVDSPTSSEHSAVFSPDGNFVAYVSNVTGREEVWLRSYPGPGITRQISSEGGTEPVWSPTGRELFYRNGNQMLSVAIVFEPDFDPGVPERLFEVRYAMTNRPDTPRDYDVSVDGQRFLMVLGENEPFAHELRVVVNWFDELKRLVPTDN